MRPEESSGCAQPARRAPNHEHPPPGIRTCRQAGCGNYFEYYFSIDTRVQPCYTLRVGHHQSSFRSRFTAVTTQSFRRAVRKGETLMQLTIRRAKKQTPLVPITRAQNAPHARNLTLVFSLRSAHFTRILKITLPRKPFIFIRLRTFTDDHRGWGVGRRLTVKLKLQRRLAVQFAGGVVAAGTAGCPAGGGTSGLAVQPMACVSRSKTTRSVPSTSRHSLATQRRKTPPSGVPKE